MFPRSNVPSAPVPADVWRHFSGLLCPSNCEPVDGDVTSDFQKRVEVEMVGLVVLGGYTQLSAGHIVVTWNISTSGVRPRPTFYELNELKRHCRPSNCTEMSVYQLGNTPLVQLRYTMHPDRR